MSLYAHFDMKGRIADLRCICASAGAVMQEQSFIAGALLQTI
jgi:hypothetical protein